MRMARKHVHLAAYERFKADASRGEISEGLRVEALFLAAFHLIDACAAQSNVHIGKHQNVRRTLEGNPRILGAETEAAWRAFQNLETRVRPKFVYGGGGTPADLQEAQDLFSKIEGTCRTVLR